MLIKVALLLHSQSPGAYKTLRDLKILTLPSEVTLRDYIHAISPTEGFNPEVDSYSYSNRLSHAKVSDFFL